MKKLLMIDDDACLTESLSIFFHQHQIELIYANDPSHGLDLLETESPALLLLDVMMPKIDGFTLCKKIRATHSLPIIMLTARGRLEDKIQGFEIGVDDYLPKPFEPLELLVRVHALLRRSTDNNTKQFEPTELITFIGLEIVPKQQLVKVDGSEVKLSGMEYHLLYTLATHPGKVFNREQIIGALKGVEIDLFGRSVDILLSRLRQKLHDSPSTPRFVKTIRGIGYTFIGTPL
ncbi:response regulator transcription factor [Pseudoalteromonas sp. MMG005]|uniref:response regulator transcription factor n=1 Tax=Pseudoalteromonas sp. MMG005 TaxID=2822682 RepID=UPI001B39CF2E|nr:response regulator transcription factor [Pseudoalteromonas sp. MMG005]MBQ4847533.1 response regulator transcription factor [Pseudoalteromonas sp. MMG005]